MTVQEAINWVDEKKHNVYSREDKVNWISQVEAMAAELAVRHGEKPAEIDEELSVPAPYDRLYLRWLEAQIDYANQEYLKYNNAMAVFNALWTDYANWFCRGHITPARTFRMGG